MLNRPDMTICRSDPCCRPAGPARARRAGPPKARARREERRTRRRRRRLDVAASKRNGARWSVALALGIRQGEALGLRWSYVDLETGVIRAWFQVQRLAWRHGCDDPHACGGQWHRLACKKGCKQH